MLSMSFSRALSPTGQDIHQGFSRSLLLDHIATGESDPCGQVYEWPKRIGRPQELLQAAKFRLNRCEVDLHLACDLTGVLHPNGPTDNVLDDLLVEAE